MSTLPEIVDGIANRLATIEGLRVVESAEQIAPPAALVRLPLNINFDQTFGRGADALEFGVIILAGPLLSRGATELLAKFLDPHTDPWSVKATLERDPSLGGLVDDCAVPKATTVTFTVAGTEYLAANFTLSIFT